MLFAPVWNNILIIICFLAIYLCLSFYWFASEKSFLCLRWREWLLERWFLDGCWPGVLWSLWLCAHNLSVFNLLHVLFCLLSWLTLAREWNGLVPGALIILLIMHLRGYRNKVTLRSRRPRSRRRTQSLRSTSSRDSLVVRSTSSRTLSLQPDTTQIAH